MKQAGQKSVKEELPKQRKAPKRAVECQLKVPTHIGSKMPGVRVSPLGPKCVDKKDAQQKCRTKVRHFCVFKKENELNNRKKSNNRKQDPVFPKSRSREMQIR